MVSLFDPLLVRSTEHEWLDDADVGGPVLHRNLRELESLNRLLGGHTSLIRGLRRALLWLPQRPLRVVDVGCGSGDGLRALSAWGRRSQVPLQLLGIDSNPEIISFARAQSADYGDVAYRQGDAFGDLLHSLRPDLVVASLFCHHFGSDVLAPWLARTVRYARAVVLSDLQRHPLAHAGFRALTRLTRASPMTRHDGAVSIRRGFTRSELEQLVEPLEVKHASIHWSFAFRYEVLLVASD